MPTTCKSWGCVGCRDRLKNLFGMRVQTGALALRRCAFITVTYKEGPRDSKPAQYVTEDWKALFRVLKREKHQLPTLKWLRVMEVTKKGMPHHHLIAGPVIGRVSCYGADFDIRRYRKHFDTCDCLSHSLARPWFQVTGDSYIVHTVRVLWSAGAAAYMAKYLDKSFGMEGRLRAIGMSRRWSSSRGWPGSGRLRLKQTVTGGWSRREYYPKAHLQEGEAKGEGSIMERVGPELLMKLTEARRHDTMARKILRYGNVKADR